MEKKWWYYVLLVAIGILGMMAFAIRGLSGNALLCFIAFAVLVAAGVIPFIVESVRKIRGLKVEAQTKLTWFYNDQERLARRQEAFRRLLVDISSVTHWLDMYQPNAGVLNEHHRTWKKRLVTTVYGLVKGGMMDVEVFKTYMYPQVVIPLLRELMKDELAKPKEQRPPFVTALLEWIFLEEERMAGEDDDPPSVA
jgi:hypothetical protein